MNRSSISATVTSRDYQDNINVINNALRPRSASVVRRTFRPTSSLSLPPRALSRAAAPPLFIGNFETNVRPTSNRPKSASGSFCKQQHAQVVTESRPSSTEPTVIITGANISDQARRNKMKAKKMKFLEELSSRPDSASSINNKSPSPTPVRAKTPQITTPTSPIFKSSPKRRLGVKGKFAVIVRKSITEELRTEEEAPTSIPIRPAVDPQVIEEQPLQVLDFPDEQTEVEDDEIYHLDTIVNSINKAQSDKDSDSDSDDSDQLYWNEDDELTHIPTGDYSSDLTITSKKLKNGMIKFLPKLLLQNLGSPSAFELSMLSQRSIQFDQVIGDRVPLLKRGPRTPRYKSDRSSQHILQVNKEDEQDGDGQIESSNRLMGVDHAPTTTSQAHEAWAPKVLSSGSLMPQGVVVKNNRMKHEGVDYTMFLNKIKKDDIVLDASNIKEWQLHAQELKVKYDAFEGTQDVYISEIRTLQEMIRKIDDREAVAFSMIKNPPTIARSVLEATAILLAKEKSFSRDMMTMGTIVLRNGCQKRLLNFDHEVITNRQMAELKRFVDDPKFKSKNIKYKFKIVSILCFFVDVMYRLRLAVPKHKLKRQIDSIDQMIHEQQVAKKKVGNKIDSL
ncbi:DNAH6 [Acrasis kona]|uniref:DNAH6 n=1 Tax=Acrasis kona TaxID=1008807 RepID=A0AAW2ZCV1_9EUKA